ncbi:MAG TPA: TonB C-terminal domain-containing protein [Candidatus Sulfotelmatobacter sp.]|nr:TonB C-terminal domain-containing protein [Candidatus Sulfotelmatobacter sp.]
MPITQIPFQDPVAPPEKGQPEQLGLYDVRGWETAYRELDERVPHLLIQLQDDLARSRKREALWISVIFHLVMFIFLWQFKLIQQYVPWHRAVVVPISAAKDKNVTFLTLPPDAQKAPHKPNTNIASDKDRIAMSRHPELDPKELRKMLATPPPGVPGLQGPRAARPMPAAPPAMAQNQPSPQPQQQGPQQQTARPQFQSNQTAQLQAPPAANNEKNVFNKYAGGMSAGSAIQQATQAAAANRGGGGGQEGDFGLGTGAKGRQQGALDILSDTQGVDFGPYLQRVVAEVRKNWYEAIPESAEMKKGKLAIEFAITRDGQIADMHIVATSNDGALDRAAWIGITTSNPFPPLPGEFTGPYLALRFRFYYNPDKSDLQ